MLKIQCVGLKMINYKRMEGADRGKVFEYLSQKRSENALFLFDLKMLYPKNVDFFLALDDKRNIRGLYLEWFGVSSFPAIHLRAENDEIADGLINKIRYHKNFRIVSPRVYSENIEKKFKNYITKDNLYFMTLDLSTFKPPNLSAKFKTNKLSNDHTSKIEKLFEGSTETDKGLEKWVLSSLDKEIFFGGFEGDTLCSIAGTLFQYEEFAMIGNVFTKKEYRRKGLATAVLSSLLDFLSKKGFKEAQLYVVENSPAYKLYKKLGFKEKGEYVRYLL